MVSLVNWNTFRNGEWGFIAVGRACWPKAPLCGRVLVGRVRRTRLSADGLARSASTPYLLCVARSASTPYLFPLTFRAARHLKRWNAIPKNAPLCGWVGALGEHALPVVCGALGEHALPLPPNISGGASFKAMECNSQFLRVGVYRT